jgi:hypothetical protein
MNSETTKGALPPAECGESREQVSAPAQQLDHHIRYDQHSRQVAWWEVHLYRERMLKPLGVEAFPMVGTPAWCALDDTDATKVAAILDAATHWALRLDTCQEAHAEASHAVSAGVDWAAVGRENQQRADFYAANPWARRVAS